MKLCKAIVSLVLTVVMAVSASVAMRTSAGAKAMYGDVDGDSQVTMKDVLKLRKIIAGADNIAPELFVNADLDFDEGLSMKDVLKLRKVLAGAEEIVPPVPDAASLVDDAFIDPVGKWDQYDSLIDSIMKETDRASRAEMMHRAEDILMATNCVVPIYYYNDVYLQKGYVSGVYPSVYGTKYFMYSSIANGSDTLRVCVGSEPFNLDPALCSATDEAIYISNLFSGLYTYDPDGRCVPACAEGLTVSEDGKTYTVTLKDGLKWSDGSPLTAYDFEYSWKRAVDPEVYADYEYLFSVFEGYEEGNIAVTAKDDATLEFTLAAPCAYMEDLMAFPVFYPVKRSEVESAPDHAQDPGAWSRNAGFVTNGAYVCTAWDHDSGMTFEKNPYWYDAGSVTTGILEILLSWDDVFAYQKYMNGDIDFVDFFPVGDITEFSENPEFHTVDELGTYYCSFNAKSSLFEGKTPEEAACMRRAISILIDRDNICENVCGNGQIPANSFIPLGMSDCNGGTFKADENDGYFDVHASSYEREKVIEEAVVLLEAAGYKFGEDGKLSAETPLALDYLTNESSGHVAIAECIKADLAEVGIDMTIRAVKWADFMEYQRAGDFDLVRDGWIADFNDPINMLEIYTTDSSGNDCQFGK